MHTNIKYTYVHIYAYSGVGMDGDKHLLCPVIKIGQMASYAFILNKNQV